MVRMFDDGALISEIVPELYLLDHYGSQVRGQTYQRGLTVVRREGGGR
jgi:hypothetical protein